MAEEFPGPPHVKNHTGGIILSETSPVLGVFLDAGAFRAVWESVEANAKRRVGTEAQAAFQRAQQAFREAFWDRPDAPSRTPGKVVRTVKVPAKKIARKN